MLNLKYKVISSLKNDNFQPRVNIHKSYIDTLEGKNNTEHWKDNFIGLYSFKSSEMDFGYKSNIDLDTVHYPIFVGICDYEIENELTINPELDLNITKYVVMFYGCDNISYFLRFNEYNDLLIFLNKTINNFKTLDDFHNHYGKDFYYYNS